MNRLREQSERMSLGFGFKQRGNYVVGLNKVKSHMNVFGSKPFVNIVSQKVCLENIFSG